jgi:hypothetical protein
VKVSGSSRVALCAFFAALPVIALSVIVAPQFPGNAGHAIHNGLAVVVVIVATFPLYFWIAWQSRTIGPFSGRKADAKFGERMYHALAFSATLFALFAVDWLADGHPTFVILGFAVMLFIFGYRGWPPLTGAKRE